MDDYGYGLWLLVVVNSADLHHLRGELLPSPLEPRLAGVLGGFSAFVIALFTEMYGYPLTVYLLTGPLGGLVPGVDLSHDAGHLWADLIGWKGDPHVSPFHLASYAFIIGGFWLISAGWRVLFAALKAETLATTGPYARLRHPQYAGFVLIMIGFLLQWPTLATLVMFPILLVVYRRLAIREEREVEARFGESWRRYAARTPRFIPRLRHGCRGGRRAVMRGGRVPVARRQLSAEPAKLDRRARGGRRGGRPSFCSSAGCDEAWASR